MAEPAPTVVWPSVLALLVSLAVSGGGLLWMQRQLEQALAVRPPVLVLDLSAAARATDPAGLPALLAAYRARAAHLAGQGVLVLEGQAVLAAPPGLSLSGQELRYVAD